jgi:hypothetical protein
VLRIAVLGGGERAFPARVQRVEPYGFTKVSALGVEEKRANVILDFVGGTARPGEGFRVTGRIVLWRSSQFERGRDPLRPASRRSRGSVPAERSRGRLPDSHAVTDPRRRQSIRCRNN